MHLQESHLSMNSEIHSSVNLIQLTKPHDFASLELQKTQSQSWDSGSTSSRYEGLLKLTVFSVRNKNGWSSCGGRKEKHETQIFTCLPKGLRKSERSSGSAMKYSGSIGAPPTLGGSRAEQHFHDSLRQQEDIFQWHSCLFIILYKSSHCSLPQCLCCTACTEVIYFLLYIHFISSVQRSKRTYVKSVSFIAHKHHFSVSTAAFIGPVFTITNKRFDLAHTRLPYCQAGKAPHVLAACFPWIMVPGF